MNQRRALTEKSAYRRSRLTTEIKALFESGMQVIPLKGTSSSIPTAAEAAAALSSGERSTLAKIPTSVETARAHNEVVTKWRYLFQDASNLVDNSTSILEKLDFSIFYCAVKEGEKVIDWCYGEGLKHSNWKEMHRMITDKVAALGIELAVLQAKHPNVSSRPLKSAEFEKYIAKKTEQGFNKLCDMVEKNFCLGSSSSKVRRSVVKGNGQPDTYFCDITITINDDQVKKNGQKNENKHEEKAHRK